VIELVVAADDAVSLLLSFRLLPPPRLVDLVEATVTRALTTANLALPAHAMASSIARRWWACARPAPGRATETSAVAIGIRSYTAVRKDRSSAR
jgi:hypothetical protein